MCRVLVEEILTRYGTALQISSDLGREFDNRLVKGVCQIMGFDKIRTSPYKASTNGAVERLHRTLNAMLRRVASESEGLG